MHTHTHRCHTVTISIQHATCMHDDTTHTRAVTTPREKRKVEGNDCVSCAEVEVLSTSQWGNGEGGDLHDRGEHQRQHLPAPHRRRCRRSYSHAVGFTGAGAKPSKAAPTNCVLLPALKGEKKGRETDRDSGGQW